MAKTSSWPGSTLLAVVMTPPEMVAARPPDAICAVSVSSVRLRFASRADAGEYWTPAFRQITSPGLPEATAVTNPEDVDGVVVQPAAYAGLPMESTSVRAKVRAATNGTPSRRTPAR